MNKYKTAILSVFVLFSMTCNSEMDVRSPITTESLFNEMIDMTGLTKFPDPAYRTVQFSSFDRRSQLPGGPEWFANSDGFGGEPIPNFEKVLKEPDKNGIGEYLIAEVEGPGAVVRLWTAAIEGIVRFYLDGQTTPLYEGPALDFFQKFFDRFSETDSLNMGRFEEAIYQRDACYTPIPFNRGMKLIWVGDIKKIHFYHVGVRLYEEGTNIVSFKPEDIIKSREVIDRVTAELLNPDEEMGIRSDESLTPFQLSVNPFEKKEALVLSGTKAVEILTVHLSALSLDSALRQTVMHIKCDGSPLGEVQSPVGDFFGAAPGINPYHSMPFTVKPDGTMVCRYVMPFKESWQLSFENLGDQEVKIRGSVLPVSYNWDDSRSMHFRARWRVNHNMIASGTEVQDLPFIIAVGQGLYVGTTSYLLNPNNVPTPYGSWWGEGDEKIFVDDDRAPSTFGTGSEDYYNYSWSSPDIFFYPYCGQPRNDGPGNRGFVTNYRWHILDPLPFQQHIRFYMELKSHERTPELSYARIGYYYARPGVTDDHLGISPEDVRDLRLPERWQPAGRMGARNSVFYSPEKNINSLRQTHLSKDPLWANGEVLVWTPKSRGESKIFSFSVDEPGKKRIHIALALTPNSGQISFLLDEEKILLNNSEDVLDLYRPYRTLLRNFTLPVQDLESGKHTLTLIYEGANPQVREPEIGFDFLWIQKQ
ncbi:glycoside hydrolase family 172 protein [Acidobacteriota bacterium]